jgi:hypothetical protein
MQSTPYLETHVNIYRTVGRDMVTLEILRVKLSV